MKQLMQALKKGKSPATVPNLVWKDECGKVHENPFSHVPTSISDVMVNQYSGIVRTVLRYRDMKSIIPYRNWLKRPVTAVYTCRGCLYDCVLCGASRTAIKGFLNRQQPAFRTAEDIYKDIKNISRFSRAPIFITHDIRLAGSERALKLLDMLEKEPVKNNLMFELFEPATPGFLKRIARAAPGFTLDISPQTHDERLRQLQGNSYTNAELETTIETALKLGTTRLDIFFIIGLPEQTAQSVMETIDYCEYLLKKFNGDKRLFLFIAAQSPFMAPGSLAFENPEKYGYKILYKTFEEYRRALTMPSWKYTLNYETRWLNRQQIADAAYEAIAHLTRAKARYGQIPHKLADAQLRRIQQARELEARLDVIIENGSRPEELAELADAIEDVNSFRAIQHRQLDVPVGLISLRYPNAVWNALFKRK
jgi:B12-binding domain/radical SAM domain protein